MARHNPVDAGCASHLVEDALESGFTLVEVMAVIFIVSIMLAMITVNIGGQSQRKLDIESEGMARQIIHAIEEAQIARNEYGLSVIDDRNYLFYQFNDQQMNWVPDDSSYFKAIDFLPAHTLDYHQDEEADPVLYKSDRKQKVTDYGESAKNTPQIIFYSDGTVTPFVIELKDADDHSSVKFISSDITGNVVVTNEK